ncbi:O-methyltransferase [Artomyces pyxidatus]|uniref:O-methyltransferase n=1 Tax=Artomyces pyxidatus TaxID=48021 RepID=A0ACB8T767_9AGAM|nr:O-methyltransferase [Artomyces pyxidatus]
MSEGTITTGTETIAELRALSEIIKNSIDRIERATAAKGLSLPSPQTPFTPESEAARSLPEVAEAGALIVSAATQLSTLVRPGPMTMFEMAMQFHVCTALRVAIEVHVPEILRDAGPKGLHVREIARQFNVDSRKLARILRLLATNHVFEEVDIDVFAQNRLSSILDSGKTIQSLLKNPDTKWLGSPGLCSIVAHITDEGMKISSYLPETLLDPEYGHSVSPNKAAFHKAYNTKSDLFQWLEEPGNESRLARFGTAMEGSKSMSPPNAILGGFDWAGLKNGSKVVDCGGGVGTQAMALFRSYPHLRFVIQDRPPVIEHAVQYWNDLIPDAVTAGKVELQGHDFFGPQPVKDASVFLLRVVIHDWPDDFAVKILRRLREAATSETKLVIVEQIVSYACEEVGVGAHSGALRAPAPLLPNLGQAASAVYYTDMQMMICLNAQERTESHFRELMERGGWKVVAVHYGAPFALNAHKIVSVPL